MADEINNNKLKNNYLLKTISDLQNLNKDTNDNNK